jgi:hypothetical protein
LGHFLLPKADALPLGFPSSRLSASAPVAHTHLSAGRNRIGARSIAETLEKAAETLQLYFASGAFADRQNKGEDHLTEPQKKRFWTESADLFIALSGEMEPATAHYIVQALHSLLSCAREVFLTAANAITSGASAGYQHESLAVSDVVKLIQTALADHRDIFQNSDGVEAECLTALLKALDLFVEAGWAEARQLTHRLEEIYR